MGCELPIGVGCCGLVIAPFSNGRSSRPHLGSDCLPRVAPSANKIRGFAAKYESSKQ